MWINGPSYFTEYPSYPYSEHYGRRIPSYFSKEIVTNYTAGYVKTNRLEQYISHGINVLNVKWDGALQHFEVQSAKAKSPPVGTTFASGNTQDGKEVTVRVEHFDFVTIATGSFNEPRSVHTPGFTGEQLHARAWVGAESYRGKNVVVVGTGDSATDMILLLQKYGAKRVYQSIRNFERDQINWVFDPATMREVRQDTMDESWTENACTADAPFATDRTKTKAEQAQLVCMSSKGISLRGGLDHADGNTVYFKNGTVAHDVDAIVYATGYRSQGSFDSFVAPELQLNLSPKNASTYWDAVGYPARRLHFPGQLHLDVLFHANPRLFYMAHNVAVYTFLEYESKAAYLAGVVAGKVPMPTPEAIAAEHAYGRTRERRWERWAAAAADALNTNAFNADANLVVAAQLWRQAEYVRELGARPDAVRKEAAQAKGMLIGLIKPRAAELAYEASQRNAMTCPCGDGALNASEYNSAWHDIAMPASPPTGDMVQAPAAEMKYMDLMDYSVECFLNPTVCNPRLQPLE